ncbi:MAG TPA: hypothetical protein DCS42_09010 [Nitrospiraceae bacterium]|nr:hypothetical protein [Nitrospiraceae bacterium]HAS54239.1 hypothetical protein [Nitrospiraceae bacterium]
MSSNHRKCCARSVTDVARRGHGVILGHGSQMLLRDFSSALHISIHASIDFRVQALLTNCA